jgi:hypothetical protein
VRTLGCMHMIAGEHALCEAIRAFKGKSPGNDAHHKDQDLLWVSTDSTNIDNILSELRVGMEPILRSESYDRISMQILPKLDSNPVKHEWWLPNPNWTECLAYFVKECLSTGSNIMEVLHSSAKASMASSMKEQQKKWRQYIESNHINVNELPEQACNLHRSCDLHMS